MDEETKRMLLIAIVTAASEELTKWLLEILAVAAGRHLKVKLKYWRARHFTKRRK